MHIVKSKLSNIWEVLFWKNIWQFINENTNYETK